MSTYLASTSGSSSSALPPTPSLSLLPFSLGSSSTPFSTGSASTAHFFQPRPCPPDTPGIPAGTPTATFRGRQLVGHNISVPPGYRGLVFTAPLPHQHQSKWPLTPAPSVASTASTAIEATGSRRSPRKSALANVASTIKAKVKGAGQVALPKPKTRQTKKEPVKRKRYQFDSDEEGEEAHVEHSAVAVKPETPGKGASTSTFTTEEVDLPKIIVQEATPLKEPLPTPKKRLGQRGAVDEGMPKKRSRSRSPDGSPTPSSVAPTEISSTDGEAVIPSPATEEDPPAFSVESVPVSSSMAAVVKSETTEETVDTSTSAESVKTEADEKNRIAISEGMPTDARILQPSSTFDSFMLWTPDGPLPGFKQDESEDTKPTANDAEQQEEQGGVSLRKGWWRTGGAGEGGDEIVRALGEWIGLVDEINRPVYLDDLKDEDSEDEE